MSEVPAYAVVEATGTRLLHLPMTPERIKEAIAKRGKPAR
jgi:CO/xanthine dehydrogenase Mo-binding subunit